MMRRSALVAFLSPVMVSAQAFGTKSDPIVKAAQTPSGPATPSAAPLIQMVIALLVVGALLKWVAPWVMKKGWLIKSAPKTQGDIQIEATASFGGGQLHVVHVKGKTLLLSAMPTGVSMLADLSEPTVTAAPAAPLFAEMVQTELERPNLAPFAFANDEDPDAERARRALDRLERLLA